jgi:sugar phosphate isomerase/epimerase
VHPSERVQQRLGLQVLFDFPDITDAIDYAHAHGFRVLELNLGNINFSRQLDSASGRAKARTAARKAGVTLALHAIDGPSFFIPSDRVRQCAVRELKRQLDWAAGVGAVNVVAHLGFDMNFGVNGGNRYTHAEFPDYYRKGISAALAELKAYARGRARLCIENVGGFRYEPIPPVLHRLLGGNLGLCLDIGHINILKPEVRRRELAFFRRHARNIFHSHVHDNSGLRDEHRALGTGRIDFKPFFRLLARTDALVVFEVRPKEAALASRDYFDREIAPSL